MTDDKQIRLYYIQTIIFRHFWTKSIESMKADNNWKLEKPEN